MGRNRTAALLAVAALAVSPMTAQAATTDLTVALSLPAPNTNWLSSVSAFDDYSAFATGEQESGVPLVVRWDGRTWGVVPIAGVTNAQLSSVAAVSHDEAWAVGTQAPGDPLIMHGHGLDWERSPSPIPTADLPALNSVSGLLHEVWTVGYARRGGQLVPISLRWTGHEWTEVPIPFAPDYLGGELSSVTVISPGDVWATGYFYTATTSDIVALHWNGRTWSIVPNAATTPQRGVAVTGVLPNNVWIAGEHNAVRSSKDYLQHWNGRAWTAGPPVPGTDEYAQFLHGLTVDFRGNLWMATHQPIALHRSAPHVRRWDGHDWTEYTVPADLLTGSAYAHSIATPRIGRITWVVLNTSPVRGVGPETTNILRADG